ncbi:MAG: MFS transporter [Pseudomonadota bacterium]
MTDIGGKRSELLSDWRLLLFGTLASLASAPGQTLVISLFNADIRSAFDLSHGEFGTAYMMATLASAVVILWSGKLIDRFDLRVVFAVTTLGLCVACLVAGSSTGWISLLLALFLLRHFGQGLMTHIAVTSVKRYYQTVRGKASAIVNQGFTLAEATLPITISALILTVGWRNSWYVLGLIAACIVLPLLLALIADHRRRHGRYLDRMSILDTETVSPDASGAQRQWTRTEMLRDVRFYGVLPVVLAPSFLNTGLMFHHQHIVQSKGWDLQTWYLLLMAYAASSIAFSMLAGAMVDRTGARRLMPLFTLPMVAGGLSLMGGANDVWIFGVLVSFGAAAGMTGAVTAPFWAEVYGVQHLGAIKAVATAVMIFASAMSPAIYGAMFDAGITAPAIGMLNIVIVLAASACAWLALRKS